MKVIVNKQKIEMYIPLRPIPQEHSSSLTVFCFVFFLFCFVLFWFFCLFVCLFVFCFSFSFSSRWHRSARKGPYALRPVSQQSPQGCPRNSANICLVEHRSFSTLEGGMSAASFLHSSFLQAVNAVMLWLVRAEKVPQASEHLCPAKLQTRCDICCACKLGY